MRTGASIRKRAEKIRQDKHALYRCDACGKISVRRIGTSIWRCKHCNATYAGGAYTMKTPAGEAAKRLVEGIKQQQPK